MHSFDSPPPPFPRHPSQEQRDALLGRIFGLGCVVRAGLASEPANAAAVADRLVAVAARKAFLREAATAVLLQLAQGLPDSGVASLVEDSAGGWLCGETRLLCCRLLCHGCLLLLVVVQVLYRMRGEAGLMPALCLLHGRNLPGLYDMHCAEAAFTQRPACHLWPCCGPALVCSSDSSAPAHHSGLKGWLAMSPEDAHPEALLAALALWPRLPAAAAAACPLLPANCRAPPPGCYDGTAASGSAAVKKQLQQAAAGVFTRQYLEKVRPVLQETTQFSHPRWV